MMLQKTQEEEINSILEVLGSRQVAEQVAESLTADVILEGRFASKPVIGEAQPEWKRSLTKVVQSAREQFHSFLFSAGVKDNISDHEMAVREVQNTVGIYAPKKSSVITISAVTKTPEVAQALARSTADAFLEQHMNVSYTEGSSEFFRQQASSAEDKLSRAIQVRSEFMQAHEIVSIDANRTLLREELSAIDRDLILAEAELKRANAEIGDLQQRVKVMEDEIVAGKQEGTDATWSGMRQRVYELELQEQNFASIYTPDHPKLVQTREQLKGAREILNNLKADRVDANRTPNPAKLRVLEELQKEQTTAIGLKSVIEEKHTQREATIAKLNELLGFEEQLLKMDREVAVLSSSLARLNDKQEEARVIDELKNTHISNVSVFQPATFVERPISPNKRVLAAGMVTMGLGLGLGLAFVRHATSRRLRTPTDVESHLGLPVLAKVPLLTRRRRRKILNSEELREKSERLIADVLMSRRGKSSPRAKAVTLGVIGVDAGSGTSTLAAHLAIAGSQACGLKTLLIDLDVKQRTVSRLFELNGAPGLLELMQGNASHDEVVQHHGQSNLDVIASSAPGSEHRMQVCADEIMSALNAYRHDCDLIVFDLPPADRPDQIIRLVSALDQVLVVVESEQTEIESADRLLRRLAQGNPEILGVVLNKTRRFIPVWLDRLFTPVA
jgi:uncharacterized protein involved in exopolysaccharide biosynthesis